ncbi:MAG: 3-dehydroquinate synthase [Pyrinomonadaceae bacterium]
MKDQTITIECPRSASSYQISIRDGHLRECGKWVSKCLGKDAAKIVIVSNPTVYKLYGSVVADNLAEAGYSVSSWLMKDGEEHKNFRSVEKAVAFFSDSGLTRTDAVVALGGGVVGDLAGFAASIYLRGIRFLQIPTTLLAMVDSSVGGKTGVNAAFGKNTIGAFHQPSGVLIDPSVLATLPARQLAAGFCEVIKHGALSGRKLFDQTAEFLKKYPLDRFVPVERESNLKSEYSDLICRNVEFKASIVAGDERESSKRTDSRSRKILNFGHTLAHALEKVTDYKYFKHGEAVGYGILYAAELSKTLALCDKKDVKLLYDVVHSVGTLPSLTNIDSQEVFEAFRFDKKRSAGSLQMVLLKGIGKPVIVNDDDIPTSAHTKALKQLLKF